jgi:hypothetical protein
MTINFDLLNDIILEQIEDFEYWSMARIKLRTVVIYHNYYLELAVLSHTYIDKYLLSNFVQAISLFRYHTHF